MIKNIVFDWGDTIMRDDPEMETPMAEWPKVELVEGAEAMLKAVSKKYTCVIASNANISDTELMRKALKRGGVEKYFTHFFTSKDLGYEKPDVKFFHMICEMSRVAPSECIMVGNDYAKDIIGAKAAGLKTVFFNEKQIAVDCVDADEIICSLDQLNEAIENILLY